MLLALRRIVAATAAMLVSVEVSDGSGNLDRTLKVIFPKYVGGTPVEKLGGPSQTMFSTASPSSDS